MCIRQRISLIVKMCVCVYRFHKTFFAFLFHIAFLLRLYVFQFDLIRLRFDICFVGSSGCFFLLTFRYSLQQNAFSLVRSRLYVLCLCNGRTGGNLSAVFYTLCTLQITKCIKSENEGCKNWKRNSTILSYASHVWQGQMYRKHARVYCRGIKKHTTMWYVISNIW